MNEALEAFRSALQSKSYVVMDDVPGRMKLIEEGKAIAAELCDYNDEYPTIPYLTATRITFDRSGLRADRYRVNLDRIPNSGIRELVEAGRERLRALSEQVEAVKREFSTDIAAICFSKPEIVGDKRAIMSALHKRKINELTRMCVEKITFPSEPNVQLSATVTIEPSGLKVRIESASYYRPGVSIYPSSGKMEFLQNYNTIKAKTIGALTQIFKSKEEVK